jgi:hypothetical protein
MLRGLSWRNLGNRGHLEVLGLGVEIILKWIFRRWEWRLGLV